MRLDRVEAVQVSKIYGRHRALSKVDLVLTPGKVVSLLGPNGSGKTTLLTLFSTLSRPTSGELRFGDLPASRAGEARRHIGLLSHASLAYGDLSALENVSFFARLYRAEAPEQAARALLEEFGLGDAMHRASRTFSRGMLQRLGLARALVGRPSLVLLDEPFTGLDRQSTAQVVERVKQLRDQGAMVLMISHDHGVAAELGDETVILHRGRLVAHHRERLSAEQVRALYAEVAERRAAEAGA